MLQKTIERENGSRRVQCYTEGPRLTEQHHRERTNIRKIMEKVRKTGRLPLMLGSPLYGDFTKACDYHEARNKILQAEKDFERLSSTIRKRFKQDPGQLIDFLANEDNRQEAIDLGIIVGPDKVEKRLQTVVEALEKASLQGDKPAEPSGSGGTAQ